MCKMRNKINKFHFTKIMIYIVIKGQSLQLNILTQLMRLKSMTTFTMVKVIYLEILTTNSMPRWEKQSSKNTWNQSFYNN